MCREKDGKTVFSGQMGIADKLYYAYYIHFALIYQLYGCILPVYSMYFYCNA